MYSYIKCLLMVSFNYFIFLFFASCSTLKCANIFNYMVLNLIFLYKQLLQLNSRKVNDPIKSRAEDLNRNISPKKTYRWLTKTWKDAQHHSLSEKCKSKPQWGTTTRQSGWLLSKSLQAIMLERVWRKGNALSLLVGMQTSTATMENSVEIP